MAYTTDHTIVMTNKDSNPLLFCAVTVNVAGVATVAQQADIDTITYVVRDFQSGLVSATPEELDPTVVIDDTPPTSGILNGMNFSFQLDGSEYLTRSYRRRDVETTFTTTGGEAFVHVFEVWT
jgi:hypothetical protein